GNAGNVSHRGDSLRIFTDIGFDVLIIDYRGYGRSAGTPSEPGLYRDATAAWDWLTQVRGIPPEEIVIFGRSLGGAVATWLAARTSPAALIVESSFDRMQSLAAVHYPLLARLIPLRVAFPAVEQIGSVRAPVLILHSPDDEIVPVRLGRRLYAAAPQPKRFVELRGGHNEGFLRSQPQYQAALVSFLDQRSASDAGD
ncbi:MAG: alpha/beta hydrolase, partial [Halochromatium sp.]